MWMLPRYDWMDKFGAGTRSLKPITEYAMKNMRTEGNLTKVYEAVGKMRRYMEKEMKKG
jgi:hypothetical protein